MKKDERYLNSKPVFARFFLLKTSSFKYMRLYKFHLLVCAADFSERMLYHALMNVYHTYFERQLIYDTYATRINKGTYDALIQLVVSA